MAADIWFKVTFGKDALGPGKVRLLEAIEETGGLSAAARKLGMSYRKAWMLVENLNSLFAQPLVEGARGGEGGGGSTLTTAGKAVVAEYRALEAAVTAAAAESVGKLEGLRS